VVAAVETKNAIQATIILDTCMYQPGIGSRAGMPTACYVFTHTVNREYSRYSRTPNLCNICAAM